MADRDSQKKVFIASLITRKDIGEACYYAGISRSTVYNWRRNDPEFKASWDSALSEEWVIRQSITVFPVWLNDSVQSGREKLGE